ncbi:uncharacterized protein LOC134851784 [Symsagittifera roscoffensis]|uniref:uncharacterized protein LOC134851784 n=1 Tax=Symsagittifera roscoffensis TaxID=84072 RepID=UPI00307C87A3
MGLRYGELVYAVLFRVFFLMYRFHEISDALNSFLGLGNIVVGIIQEFVNGFLFFHSVTFVFIASTCLFKEDCPQDTLIRLAVDKFLYNKDALFTDKNALIYITTFYFVITVTTSAGFGDLVPRNLLETQISWVMAVMGKVHAAYMMGIIASLYSFGVDKKTQYYDESLRLKTELDLILRSQTRQEIKKREKLTAEDREEIGRGEVTAAERKEQKKREVERDGLTAAERTDIEKYADIGWNLSEGIHMSSPEVFKNTPYSINAAEKVELYRSFLLKILRLSKYDMKVQELLESNYLPFKNKHEVRRVMMRVLCFLVKEQFLLTGTEIAQDSDDMQYYTIVKKGEIISMRSEEPVDELLMEAKYKVTSTCLIFLIDIKELDEHLNDYVERATGSMARSVSISGSDSQSGASKKEGDEATNQSGENNEEPEIIIETEEPPQTTDQQVEASENQQATGETAEPGTEGQGDESKEVEVTAEVHEDGDAATPPEQPRRRRRRRRRVSRDENGQNQAENEDGDYARDDPQVVTPGETQVTPEQQEAPRRRRRRKRRRPTGEGDQQDENEEQEGNNEDENNEGEGGSRRQTYGREGSERNTETRV